MGGRNNDRLRPAAYDHEQWPAAAKLSDGEWCGVVRGQTQQRILEGMLSLPGHCLPQQVGSARGGVACRVLGHGVGLAGRGRSADVERGEGGNNTARLVA
jgi:hypothetical protein